MLQLMLLRHAKSNWSKAALADLDRPLNDRGKRAASVMGRYMVTRGFIPDLVLCSPATRARDTWKRVAAEIETPTPTLIDQRIYDFGNGEILLDCIHLQAAGAKSLLLIGHSPSIEGLAQTLAATGDEKLRRRLANKYPTCGLAVITVNVPDWAAVSPGSGTLVRFVRPKDIITSAED